jgi:hypothetical protein
MSKPIARGCCSALPGAATGLLQGKAVKGAKASAQAPSIYVLISAPLAQSVRVKVKLKHDIVNPEFHGLPPGETDKVVIARRSERGRRLMKKRSEPLIFFFALSICSYTDQAWPAGTICAPGNAHPYSRFRTRKVMNGITS